MNPKAFLILMREDKTQWEQSVNLYLNKPLSTILTDSERLHVPHQDGAVDLFLVRLQPKVAICHHPAASSNGVCNAGDQLVMSLIIQCKYIIQREYNMK